MSNEPLSAAHILDAAEDVLRKHGPAKANVVDVARALGVSHGSVYRHFPSKAALRDAVAARWLRRVADPLADIAHEDGPAEERLMRWLRSLAQVKRRKVFDDPELFATYHAIAEESRTVVSTHVAELTDQLDKIIRDGMAEGVFSANESHQAARAVFDTTLRFHHPAHRDDWENPNIDAAFDAVVALLLEGLRRRPM